MNKAIFLDRDGVINELVYDEERGIFSPKNIAQFKILPQVKEAIKEFKKLGYKVVIISNQPGIAFGYIKKNDLDEIDELIKKEIGIEHIYYCPHHPKYSGECTCRKPEPGLLLQAAKNLKINISESFMVGDRISDIQAGKDCKKTFFLGTKRCDICHLFEKEGIYPDYFVSDLMDMVKIINNSEV